jgi:prepilin-type N-terminal cleavage/methylation domain-containing protein
MTATRLRCRASGGSGERGVTLAEMLVTMMVLSLLMVMVVSLVTSVTRTFTRERSATDSTRNASVAMKEITRVIRSGTEIRVNNQPNAPVFLSATSESVVLRSFLDTSSGAPKPIVARFEITTARDLVEKRWNANAASGPFWTFTNLPVAPFQATPTYWTNPAYVRTIARGITTTAVSGVSTFCYYAADGTEIVPSVAGSLTDAQLGLIAAVKVTVSVQADKTGRASAVTLENTVGIPNLGISRVGA